MMTDEFDRLPEPFKVQAALEPILCTDCAQYVPLGWLLVISGPKCPNGVGATGVQYGHRASNSAIASILDKYRNMA